MLMQDLGKNSSISCALKQNEHAHTTRKHTHNTHADIIHTHGTRTQHASRHNTYAYKRTHTMSGKAVKHFNHNPPCIAHTRTIYLRVADYYQAW